MANNALDNLFLMPTPLPAASTVLPPAGNDRGVFNNALKRAYQPAAPPTSADGSPRPAETRPSPRDDTSAEAGPPARDKLSRDGGDKSIKPQSANRRNRSDKRRLPREPENGGSSNLESIAVPRQSENTIQNDNKDATTPQPEQAVAKTDIQKTHPDPAAKFESNAILDFAAAQAGAHESAQPVAAANVEQQAPAQPPLAGVSVVANSPDKPGGTNPAAAATATAAQNGLVETPSTLAPAAIAKLDRPANAPKQQPESIGAKLAEKKSASSAEDRSNVLSSTSPEELPAAPQDVPSPRVPTSKQFGRGQKIIDQDLNGAAEKLDDAALQIAAVDRQIPNSVSFNSAVATVPFKSGATDRAANPADDDEAASQADAKANQPATLSGARFADALREIAPNLPGHITTDRGNGKPTFAGEPRGVNQLDQARLVQRVAKAFRAADDQGGQIRLRLSPPELGSLKLEVAMRNGVMTARLEAETNSARTLLLDNLPALRERLADQNIKIERFDVDLRQDGRGDGSAQPPPDFSGARQNLPRSPQTQRLGRAPGTGAETTNSNGDPRRTTGDGRLNVIV